jgi:hypothetical protein
MPHPSPVRRLLLASLLLSAGGCETFTEFREKRGAERDTAIPANRTVLEPISRNYFEQESPTQGFLGA